MTRHTPSILCLSSLTLLLSGPASALEVVIDFQSPLLEHISANPVYVSTWEEDGFRLTSNIDLDLQSKAFGAWGTSSSDYPGSTALFVAEVFAPPLPTTITLNRIDGGAFDARGISLAPLTGFLPAPESLVFTGQLAPGGFVTQTVSVASSLTLQPFTFDTAFANLVALRWDQSVAEPHQFDDIRLAVAAVPEPAMALCMFCGLLALAALRSRSSG